MLSPCASNGLSLKRARGSLALIGALLLLAGPSWADTLPREWAVGLPEPSEYAESEEAANAFCPLGVCQPRSRDSLYASAAFGLAALASAYIGRRRRPKPPSSDLGSGQP